MEKKEERRCVVVSGAKIENYPAASAYLRRGGDYMIYCDSGLSHAEKLDAPPDLIVGDFDSHAAPKPGEYPGAEIITLHTEKDDTDTEHALHVALARGFTDFLLLGALGGRFDHSLGNIALLGLLFSQGCRALLVDDFSEMEIVGREPAEIPDSFPFFSVLPLGGPARGVFEENAKYPLSDALLSPETSLGISNEPLPGRAARVWTREGRLLLIRVREKR